MAGSLRTCKFVVATILTQCRYLPPEGHFTHETESQWPLHIKHSHWWEKAELVQVRFTVRSRDQCSVWMQDGCKVYTCSYIASNGSCFMITWIIFEIHLLEVGLTQNRETMALWKFTTVDLFYFYHVWRRAWIEFHWKKHLVEDWWHMASHYTWVYVTMSILHDFGGVFGRPLDTFYWALTSSWSRLLACLWSHKGRFTHPTKGRVEKVVSGPKTTTKRNPHYFSKALSWVIV